MPCEIRSEVRLGLKCLVFPSVSLQSQIVFSRSLKWRVEDTAPAGLGEARRGVRTCSGKSRSTHSGRSICAAIDRLPRKFRRGGQRDVEKWSWRSLKSCFAHVSFCEFEGFCFINDRCCHCSCHQDPLQSAFPSHCRGEERW